MIELTKEQITEMFRHFKSFYGAYNKLELELKNGYYRTTNNCEFISRCYCKINNGKIIHGVSCKYCGESIYDYLLRKEDVKKLNDLNDNIEWGLRHPKNTYTVENFYYVCKNPNEEFGLLILKIKLNVKFIGDEDNLFEEGAKIEKIIYVNSNKESKAYKISRGKEVETDLFDAFNLNSKTADNDVNIIWQDANGMLDFLLKNKDLCKRFGILECFNNLNIKMPRNAFFMFYMYIYCEYPVVELLVKMNNIKLVSDIMKNLAGGYNKENIRNKSKELNKLLNGNATKGSLALRIPKYISDFLCYKEARIDEFLVWCDLYEMENFSKEQFEEIIEDGMYYVIVNRCGFSTFLNVMRYGYTYKKLVKYIDKQTNGNIKDYNHYLRLLDDYRNMMNIMEVEADEYPSNIKTAHDNAMKAYKAVSNKLNDKVLSLIAQKLEKVKEIENDKYMIVVPEKVADFVEEGNKQHNCVGSYTKKVIDRKSIVFFIRKKDEPDESFVTAEFCNDRLYQIMYKNNVRVWDKDVLDFANSFCNKIKGMHLIK